MLNNSYITIKPTYLESVQPIKDWVHINHQSKQFLTDMVIGQSDLNNSSIEVSSTQVTLDYTKLTVKTNEDNNIYHVMVHNI